MPWVPLLFLYLLTLASTAIWFLYYFFLSSFVFLFLFFFLQGRAMVLRQLGEGCETGFHGTSYTGQ